MKTVVKAAIREGNKYLIALRADNKEVFPLHWEFIGGKLEEGEDQKQCLEREVFEETGLSVEPLELLGRFEQIVKGELVEVFLYSARKISGKITLSPEHIEYRWATKEAISKLKTEPYVKVIYGKH